MMPQQWKDLYDSEDRPTKAELEAELGPFPCKACGRMFPDDELDFRNECGDCAEDRRSADLNVAS